MSHAPEQLLHIPQGTLDAIARAQEAAGRARVTVEAARADLLGGMAMTFVGLGAAASAGQGLLGDVNEWVVRLPAALVMLAGTVLCYAAIWRRLQSRAACGINEGEHHPANRRRQLAIQVVAIVFPLLGAVAFQLSKPVLGDDLFFRILIFNLWLCVAGGVGAWIYRFTRVHFWEHLAFAAATAGTCGVYVMSPYLARRVPPGLMLVVLLGSLLIVVVASASLFARRRRLAATIDAQQIPPGSAS